MGGPLSHRAVVSFRRPEAEASFAITRDRSAASDSSLASYVDRQLVDMAESCPKFELVRRERIALNGASAEAMEFSWRSPIGTFVRQMQTVLAEIGSSPVAHRNGGRRTL
jgi:hypothetical protein